MAPLLSRGATPPREATAGAGDVPTLSGAAAQAVAPSTAPEELMEPEVHEAFLYHSPTEDQIRAIQTVREALGHAFNALRANVPSCAEQTLAIRKLEEASMWANKAIVFDGRRYL